MFLIDTPLPSLPPGVTARDRRGEGGAFDDEDDGRRRSPVRRGGVAREVLPKERQLGVGFDSV
jgi:hypothetical protein